MYWSKKGEYTKTLHIISYLDIKYERKRIFEKKKEKKSNEKNGKFPRTGSPSWLGPLSRYNALPTELRGTCHEWRENFKMIWNKWSTCCKKEVNKDFVGEVFWPWNDILTKTSLFDSFMFKFNSVLEIRSRTTSFPWPFSLLGGGAPYPQVRKKAMDTRLGAGSKK